MKSQVRDFKAGVTRVAEATYFLPACLHSLNCLLATGKSFIKKMAEVLDDARDKVGSTKPTNHLHRLPHATCF